jgi:predicted MPP superfamily phosphohydrolase
MKQLTAPQAFKTIGGNHRLSSYIEKVYKGNKTLDEWKSIFEKDKIK